ncbi:hypothetical protein BDZ89DRAFT_1112076 [Hymenopellis radicata]|nr:hypothetical protein BDZ89DRAFT_1112076 [Hymenopellis radicata]
MYIQKLVSSADTATYQVIHLEKPIYVELESADFILARGLEQKTPFRRFPPLTEPERLDSELGRSESSNTKSYDSSSPLIHYTGAWSQSRTRSDVLRSVHTTVDPKATAMFTFTGTGIEWFGKLGRKQGIANDSNAGSLSQNVPSTEKPFFNLMAAPSAPAWRLEQKGSTGVAAMQIAVVSNTHVLIVDKVEHNLVDINGWHPAGQHCIIWSPTALSVYSTHATQNLPTVVICPKIIPACVPRWYNNGAGNGVSGYGNTKDQVGSSNADRPVLTPVLYDPTAQAGNRFTSEDATAKTPFSQRVALFKSLFFKYRPSETGPGSGAPKMFQPPNRTASALPPLD